MLADTLRNMIHQGGLAAYAILLTGVVLLILAPERLYYLYVSASFDSRQAMESLRASVLSRNYTKAIQFCNQQPANPELSVIKAGLIAVENGRDAMKSAMGNVVMEISENCEERLPIIALIASASTLLGLLGTIIGLITTFGGMAAADPGEKSRLLGLGISEAMSSTAAGLVVGIAAMAMHTICVSKADALVAKSHRAGLKLVTWIEQGERSGRG